MTEEKKYLAAILEVDFYDGEVQAIYPVTVETCGHMTEDQLKAAQRYLNTDEDASYDFMWALKELVDEAVELDTRH